MKSFGGASRQPAVAAVNYKRLMVRAHPHKAIYLVIFRKEGGCLLLRQPTEESSSLPTRLCEGACVHKRLARNT
jgi:hypothetical protein